MASFFLSAIETKDRGLVAPPLVGLTERARRGDRLLSADVGDQRCHFLVSSPTCAAKSEPDRNVLVVFHGELYPVPDESPAAFCLKAYLRTGVRFVNSLNGSFALAVLDGLQETIQFVSDPLNTRKLFFGEHDGVIFVSTMNALRLHPSSGKPDPAGLAHAVVNGVPLNGRTPFDGIRVLDRGSIHQIRGALVTSEPYWHYNPEPNNGASASSLKRDLRDALSAAVGRRLPTDGGVGISLSGGYDSTAVLGTLRQMGVPGVHCFTYARSMEPGHNDAVVARQTAAIAGYSYTEVAAYADDAVAVVGDNIQRGHGLTRLVVETDAWRALNGLLPAQGCSTLWVADECFGMHPPRTLVDRGDAMNSLGFADWSSLGTLGDLFPSSVASLLEEALQDDLESMVERSRAISDPYALRDYLYIDQRLPRLLSWREAFAGSCGEVRNPLIDKDILELRQMFPAHFTLDKRLYRETVAEMFPGLFAIPRARSFGWLAGQWCRDALRGQSAMLASMIRDNSSPLDSYLPPEGLLHLLEREAGSAGAARRVSHSARAMKGRVWKRVRSIGRPNVPALRPRKPTVDPAVFILRVILLRELYRQRSTN